VACNDQPVQRLLPSPGPVSDDEFVAAYEFPARRPCVRASMVTTLDGATRGPDGGSRSISSEADARIFSFLRRAADVILVGAGTMRAERYQPSRYPIAIVTRSGHLPASLPIFADRTAQTPSTLILTTVTAKTPDWMRAVCDVVPCGENDVDLPTAIAALADRGLGRIHCEGGPGLLGDLAHLDLIDELALSISPLLLGAPGKEHLLSVPGGLVPPGRWRLLHVMEEDGTTFLRLGRP
jgi:riboflavin biosynthesis pyrimidine reductase